MNFNFNKKNVVGISITPEIGLEAAQIDFEHKKVLKYGRKNLEYDVARNVITDPDAFKEALADLLLDLDIPKGTQLVLNVPTIFFKVADYQNVLTDAQITDSILEDLSEIPAYQDEDFAISVAHTGVSSIQTKRLVSTVAQKSMLVEMVMQIKELGYKLASIDVSVNSVLNALICEEKVDTSSDNVWLLLLVEGDSCRVITMQGGHYTDCYEEKIAIGEVFGDDENYRTIIDTVNPILNNTPAQYLFIVSKTNLISAELLAGKLKLSMPIVHLESNILSKQPLMEIDDSIPEDFAKNISIDVIGAGVKPFYDTVGCNINLFNDSLGNIFAVNKPLSITIGGKKLILSLENMIVVSIAIIIITLVLLAITLGTIHANISSQKNILSNLNTEIENINTELKANESVSSEIFDESSEIKIGLSQNKRIYSYYTIVGTEIPKQLWLTRLKLDEYTTIEGQADNLESIYAFYRSIKDYDTTSADLKLQKLELASKQNGQIAAGDEDKASILSSLTADFYQFKISNEVITETKTQDTENKNSEGDNNTTEQKKNKKPSKFLPSSSLETAD